MLTHYTYKRADRMKDTGSFCYDAMGCLTGDGHATGHLRLTDVDCPHCLESMPYKRAVAREALGLPDKPNPHGLITGRLT